MNPDWRRLVLLTLLVAATSGCASFDRAWDEAGATPTPTNNITGRWEGTWKSDDSGHTDQLRCIISESPGPLFPARFHAHYKRVFSFGYTVPLRITRNGNQFQFSGDSNLGWLAGGVYHYDGTATPDHFQAEYKSKHDHGTFELRRPDAPAETDLHRLSKSTVTP